MRAQINDFMPLARQMGPYLLLELESGVIGAKCNSHRSQRYTGRIAVRVVKSSAAEYTFTHAKCR
jgi:hypothetical protein